MRKRKTKRTFIPCGGETPQFSTGAACFLSPHGSLQSCVSERPECQVEQSALAWTKWVCEVKEAGAHTSTATSLHTQLLPTHGPSTPPFPHLKSLIAEGHNYFQILLVPWLPSPSAIFHFLFQPLVPGSSRTLELAHPCVSSHVRETFADGLQVGRQVTATIANNSYLFCIRF